MFINDMNLLYLEMKTTIYFNPHHQIHSSELQLLLDWISEDEPECGKNQKCYIHGQK